MSIGGIALFTFGDALFQPSASGLIASTAPNGRQGEIQGANQAQQSIARTVGPMASAWLYGLLAGGPYMAAAIVVLMAAGGLTCRPEYSHPGPFMVRSRQLNIHRINKWIS